MRRRTFLRAAAVGGVGLVGYAAGVEPRILDVTRHRIRLGGPDGGAVGPAPSRDGPTPTSGRIGPTLAHLPDLHFGGLGAIHRRIAELLHDEGVDLVVLPGDTVEEPGGLTVLEAFLGLLPDVPVWAVPGNWEYWGGVSLPALRSVLRETRGGLLVNESVTVEVGGERLRLTGVDDWVAGEPDIGTALAGAEADAGDGSAHLVLCHCPIYLPSISRALAAVSPGSAGRSPARRRSPGSPDVPTASEQSPDAIANPAAAADPPPTVVFAGHTHGGQVDLLGLRFTPTGSGDYVEGWYREPGPPLYVSRGVGTSVVPLRLGSRPEAAIFELVRSGADTAAADPSHSTPHP